MKLLLLLSVLFLGATLWAQDSNRWTIFQSLDWEGRLNYLQETPAVQTDGEFLLRTLQLVDSDRIDSGSDKQISDKKNIALQVIRLLAETPTPGATAAIAKIPRQYKDPILRGDSWMALAKLGDQASIPEFVVLLAALNESGGRLRSEEIQAAYLVQALGLLKSPSSFRVLAAASLAWYSPVSGVKVQARKFLPLVVPDYEKSLLQLLAEDADLALREGLFQTVLDQNDAAASARAASAVLTGVVVVQTKDKADQDRLGRMTLAALLAAQKAPAPPPSLLPSIKTLTSGVPNAEVLTQSVRLLAKIDDPGAVAQLTALLYRYNAQQKAGTNKPQDLLLVRELFQALTATGKASARPPLEDAKFSNYTPAQVREAQAALDKLPRD